MEDSIFKSTILVWFPLPFRLIPDTDTTQIQTCQLVMVAAQKSQQAWGHGRLNAIPQKFLLILVLRILVTCQLAQQ